MNPRSPSDSVQQDDSPQYSWLLGSTLVLLAQTDTHSLHQLQHAQMMELTPDSERKGNFPCTQQPQSMLSQAPRFQHSSDSTSHSWPIRHRCSCHRLLLSSGCLLSQLERWPWNQTIHRKIQRRLAPASSSVRPPQRAKRYKPRRWAGNVDSKQCSVTQYFENSQYVITEAIIKTNRCQLAPHREMGQSYPARSSTWLTPAMLCLERQIRLQKKGRSQQLQVDSNNLIFLNQSFSYKSALTAASLDPPQRALIRLVSLHMTRGLQGLCSLLLHPHCSGFAAVRDHDL